MRPGRLLPLALAGLLLTAAAAGPTSAASPATALPSTAAALPATGAVPDDPAAWDDRRLAASLLLAGYDMRRIADAEPWVRDGLGGVVLFGPPPGDLRHRLTRLRAAGPVPPMVASDEEGGRVQRLRPLLGALPSAEAMASSRTPDQVQALAAEYGRGMRFLGVDVGLAPVADLGLPGWYMETTDRAFGSTPETVTRYAGAWTAGLRAAGVIPVVKHWPGHGQATDTHQRAATTPPLPVLEQRDLLPFDALLRGGAPSVMVGHLTVPGLTEPGLPASLSPGAYRYLRQRGGGSALLMTDSLSMRAVTASLGLTPAQAAVRALTAGADMVMVDPGPGPGPVVDAVSRALADGSYPRAAAVASATRVLQLKRTAHPPLPLSSLQPAPDTTGGALTPTLGGLVQDPLGGALTARFYVRRAGSTSWDVVDGGLASAPSGSRALRRLPEGLLAPGTTYEWTARACHADGRCSPPTPVLRFTTRPAPVPPTARPDQPPPEGVVLAPGGGPLPAELLVPAR